MPSGRVVRISGVTIDVTDRKEAEERQNLLAREVDHRARNALAVIQSIIRLTRARSVDEYVAAIEGRIKALARAHTLLSDSRWEGADLATLVGEELDPYRSGRQGHHQGSRYFPAALDRAGTGAGVARACHQRRQARRAVVGERQSEPELAIAAGRPGRWTGWKAAVRRSRQPAAKSFGLRVIRASIEQQLDGETAFDWDPNGLRCSFSIPRRDMMKSRGIPRRAQGRSSCMAARTD